MAKTDPTFMLGHSKRYSNTTSLERAFELARSGNCIYFSDIVEHIKSEGYSVEQLHGASLKKQLLELIEKSKKTNA
jgi:hypothetical protein